MMKKLFVALSVSLVISQYAFAMFPPKCPDINALQTIVWEKATGCSPVSANCWNVQSERNNLGTNYSWIFAMGEVKANSPENAFKNAKKILKNMQLISGPTKDSQIDLWACTYYDGKHPASAMTCDNCRS